MGTGGYGATRRNDGMDAVRGGISTPEWREVYGQSVAQDVIETGRVLLEYPESSPKTEQKTFGSKKPRSDLDEHIHACTWLASSRVITRLYRCGHVWLSH